MTLSISTSKTYSKEIGLYFESYIKDLILYMLSNKFDDLEKAYDFLVNEYNKILIEKKLKPYKNYCIDKDPEQKIFSLILSCERNDRNIYNATILKLADKLELEYLKLFLIIHNRVMYEYSDGLGSRILIKKEFVKDFLELLKAANEKGYFVSSKTMVQGISDLLNKKETPVKDIATEIINDIESNIETIDYVMIQHSDEYIDRFVTYKELIGINYKETICSSEFQKFLQEECEGINYIEDLDDIILEYIEESMDIEEEIVKYMLKNNKGCILGSYSIENCELEEKTLLDNI